MGWKDTIKKEAEPGVFCLHYDKIKTKD